MNLSEHLTSEVFTFSDTAARHGIDNSLPAGLIYAAQVFAYKLYEPLFNLLGHFHINSGFRSAALNAALPGSSKTSQHMKANALDIVPTMGLVPAFKTILTSGIVFDQLMLEGVNAQNPTGRWIHISYNSEVDDTQQRKEIKLVTFDSGTPVYHVMSYDEALAWCEAH